MNNIKKYSFLLFTLLLVSSLSFAQTAEVEEDNSKDSEKSILDKLVFGGNVGIGYSNGWNINLSPTIGYKVTPTTILGVGITYIHSDFRNPWDGLRWTQDVTGARVFGQQLLFGNLYAHAEGEYLTFTAKITDETGRIIDKREIQAPGLLLGGGYSTSFGYGLGFTFEVLYNVLYRADTSPYPSPIVFRGGLMFGF
jgi:hypothetical protein